MVTEGPDPFESWAPARLISTAGIKRQEEQERRATSALLAVLPGVPEFAYALLRDLGAPKGRIRTFTEVNLEDADGGTSIPDGAIVVDRGKTRWAAFVEVKTGDADLSDEQVGRYLDQARGQGFNGVLTISNRITPSPFDSPIAVDRRRLRGLGLWHLSWWRVLTEAVVQHRFRGIAEPDQAWILGELIAYLDHERSGAADSRTWATSGSLYVRLRTTAPCGRRTARRATSSSGGSSSATTWRWASRRISAATSPWSVPGAWIRLPAEPHRSSRSQNQGACRREGDARRSSHQLDRPPASRRARRAPGRGRVRIDARDDFAHAS